MIKIILILGNYERINQFVNFFTNPLGSVNQYNSIQMRKNRTSLTCHLCNFSKKEMAQCSIPRCSKCYCLDCIKSFLDNSFSNKKYIKQCWICYSCGKNCKCDICLGNLPSRKRQLHKKQKHTENKLNILPTSLQKQQNFKDLKNFQQEQILKPENLEKQCGFVSKIKVQNEIECQIMHFPTNDVVKSKETVEKQKKNENISERQIQLKSQTQEVSLTLKFQQHPMSIEQQQQLTFFHYLPYAPNIEFPRFTFFYF